MTKKETHLSSVICHPPSDREAVLITGAAKRVGREIALYLAREGYDIALHCHTSRDEAEATRGDIEALGRTCAVVQADLADVEALPRLMEEAVQALPNLAHLVNNASVFDQALLMESSAELMQRQMRVNFEAPALLTQEFAKRVNVTPANAGVRIPPSGGMTTQHYSVTNILDSKINKHRHSYFFYLLSKKALAEFTRMAAVELAPDVRVNGVAPGIVMPSSDGLWGDAYMKEEAARLPLKQTALPADVARAVHFFVSTPALTGQILFVDGGASLG